MKWPTTKFFQIIGMAGFTLGVFNTVIKSRSEQDYKKRVDELLEIIQKKEESMVSSWVKNVENNTSLSTEMKTKAINKIREIVDRQLRTPIENGAQSINELTVRSLKYGQAIEEKTRELNLTIDPIKQMNLTREIELLQNQQTGITVKINDFTSSSKFTVKVTDALSEISKVIDDVSSSGSKFLGSSKFDDIILWMNNLDFVHSLAIVNLLGIFIIMITIISIIFIFYGNKLLDYLNIEERFPKLANLIILRRKFNQYYLIWNILVITIVSIVMFIMNLLIFI